jgi:hypothetical protein
MKGIVYVKKDKALLPGPLGIVGSSMAYDDRDVSDAQKACVDAFNKKASETKDSTFSVSGSNFDCENAKVSKIGSYYSHSVTMTNLDENSTYNFVVGDGIWSFKESFSIVKTFTVLDTVGEPMPVFGRITGDDGTYSRDAIVYITFNDGSEGKDSIVYSSAVNDDGGWYVDASSVRDVQGNVLPLEVTNDTFRIRGIYSNYGKSDEQKFIFGFFEVTTFDILVKKTQPVSSSILDRLVMGAYASCGKNTSNQTVAGVAPGGYICTDDEGGWKKATAAELAAEASTIGAGNVLKLAAAENGGVVPQSVLNTLGVSTNEAKYITSQQSSVAYCNGTEYCSNGNCSETEGKCGYKASNPAPGSSPSPSCSPASCTPTSTASSVICVDGVVKSFPNSTCVSTTSTSGTTSPTPTYVCTEGSCNSSNQYCSNNSWKFINEKCGYYTGASTSAVSQEKCSIVGNYDAEGGLLTCSMSCNNGKSFTMGLSSCKAIVSEVVLPPNIAASGTHQEIPHDIVVSQIKILELSIPRIKKLAENTDSIKDLLKDEVEKMEAQNLPNSGPNSTQFNGYCEIAGGTSNALAYPFKCDFSGTQNKNPFVVSKVYAAETATVNSYALYMPEYGMYSFELGDYTMSSNVSDGKTMYLFYVEANDVEGFQMPADPDNPTSEEDIVLSSSASEITYKQESTAQQYVIKKGINIISFDFVPVSTDTGAYTAKDVISQALDNGVEVQYISTFEGGRWNSGYSCSSDTCTGNNFTIVPGKGYLVYATQDGTVTIPGYNLTSSVPVAFSAGWNLIGVHGYTTAYTARSFIDSINKVTGLTANNVSWWPTSKSKYEGVEVDNGTQYGLDFSISPNNGYFVRISKFAPTDTKCKSLIWNAGGSLNGTCGNTK